MKSDFELLQSWAGARNEAAFAELVRRHVGLVLGVAQRRCHGNFTLAEEVSQRVFTMLARKAGGLVSATSLAGWLHRATVLECAHLVRHEALHAKKLAQLAYNAEVMNRMDSSNEPVALAAEVDAALEKLSAADRQILLLRFYEGRSFAEIAAMLGKNADSAQKQSSRALERLAQKLGRSGVATTTTAVLTAFFSTQFSVPAAPAFISTLTTQAVAQAGHISGWAAFTHTLKYMAYGNTGTLAACALILSLASFYGSYSLGKTSGETAASQPASVAQAASMERAKDASATAKATAEKSSVLENTEKPTSSPRPLRDVLADIAAVFVVDMKRRSVNFLQANVNGKQVRMSTLADFDPEQLDEALKLLPEFRGDPKKYESLAAFLFSFLKDNMPPRQCLETILKPEFARDGNPPIFAVIAALQSWSAESPTEAWAWAKAAGDRGLLPMATRNPMATESLAAVLGQNPASGLQELTQLQDKWKPYAKQALRETLSDDHKEAVLAELKGHADDRLSLLVADCRPVVDDWTRDQLLPWLLDRPMPGISTARLLQNWDRGHFEVLCQAVGSLTSPTAKTRLKDYLAQVFANRVDRETLLDKNFKDAALRKEMAEAVAKVQLPKVQ